METGNCKHKSVELDSSCCFCGLFEAAYMVGYNLDHDEHYFGLEPNKRLWYKGNQDRIGESDLLDHIDEELYRRRLS